MTTCPTCAGKRTIETTVPNIKKSGGVEYVSAVQPTKLRLDVCPACHGRGAVEDLDAIRDRTFADQLARADRAQVA